MHFQGYEAIGKKCMIFDIAFGQSSFFILNYILMGFTLRTLYYY